MKPELIECMTYGDSLLGIIKSVYPSKAQSTYIGANRIWNCSQLCNYMQISWGFFKDIIALLESTKLIRLIDDGIEITNEGRVHIIKGGYIFPEDTRSYHTIKLHPAREIKFKPMLSKKQQSILIEKIGQRNSINDPQKFVEFINGDNDGSNITIDKEGAQFISFLLFTLYQKGKIKLTYGKGYRKLVQSKIFAFSPGIEKAKMKNFIDGVKKSDSLQRSIGKHCDKIDSLLSK